MERSGGILNLSNFLEKIGTNQYHPIRAVTLMK